LRWSLFFFYVRHLKRSSQQQNACTRSYQQRELIQYTFTGHAQMLHARRSRSPPCSLCMDKPDGGARRDGPTGARISPETLGRSAQERDKTTPACQAAPKRSSCCTNLYMTRLSNPTEDSFIMNESYAPKRISEQGPLADGAGRKLNCKRESRHAQKSKTARPNVCKTSAPQKNPNEILTAALQQHDTGSPSSQAPSSAHTHTRAERSWSFDCACARVRRLKGY